MENHPSTVSVLADCVTIVEMDDIKVVRVSHPPKATADISLHGAIFCHLNRQDKKMSSG